jgi:SAM-dependent methyltransferase
VNVEEYQRMFEAEERQWWYAGMRSIAFGLLDAALARERASRRLLDAGCGTGHNLLHLGERGRAYGVDLSEEAIRFCRTRGVAAARGSVLQLPFAAGSFDAVTSFDVIYHQWVNDDRSAVAEMARVLKPGGLLLVRVPAFKALWGAHDEAVHSRHRYTRGELAALLRSQGFELVRATYCNFFLFPLLIARRSLDRATGRHGSDVQFLPPLLERTFRGLLEVEALLSRSVSLPFGTSVVVLGRKPPSGG